MSTTALPYRPSSAGAPAPGALVRGRVDSPIGELVVVCDGDGRLCVLDFADRPAHLKRTLHRWFAAASVVDSELPDALTTALAAWFDGDLDALAAIETATVGDPFAQRVWAALRRIPAGHVTTYGAIAREIDPADPRLAIAVGAANGANPVAIVVPCHRVIASDGSLRGYAGGLWRKQWLLAHEAAASGAEGTTARLPLGTTA